MLDLTINDEDGTKMVESKRGNLFCTPLEKAEIIEEVLDMKVREPAAINEAEGDELTTIGEDITRTL